ncbi:hypothetical protein PMAYCL1PPCAC_13606, partial [Pristionchus mayeri]
VIPFNPPTSWNESVVFKCHPEAQTGIQGPAGNWTLLANAHLVCITNGTDGNLCHRGSSVERGSVCPLRCSSPFPHYCRH